MDKSKTRQFNTLVQLCSFRQQIMSNLIAQIMTSAQKCKIKVEDVKQVEVEEEVGDEEKEEEDKKCCAIKASSKDGSVFNFKYLPVDQRPIHSCCRKCDQHYWYTIADSEIEHPNERVGVDVCYACVGKRRF